MEHLEKSKMKEIIMYPVYISKLFTAVSSYWANFEKWCMIYLRIVHLRHRKVQMWALAPMWSRVVLVVTSHLLQVCTMCSNGSGVGRLQLYTPGSS